jgi:hypothetical protein
MNMQVLLLIEAWSKCPFPIIPEEKRVKKGELAICKGNCNSIKKIDHTKYQLCGNCSSIYRFHGASCDVPNCDSVADGKMSFRTKENKIVCNGYFHFWRRQDFCVWERFVEERQLHFKRPETFVKALELGFVYPVENPVKRHTVAECHHCHRNMAIRNTTYQLCSLCRNDLQYYGEKCSVGGVEPCDNDAIAFDTDESRFVCGQCHKAKSKYNLSSYLIYERNIRSVVNCNLCNRSVSHNLKEGSKKCTAFIDHDHETGKTRGVLCIDCNAAEGFIKKTGTCPQEWGKRLIDYYEKSPLSKSWVQND